MKSFGPKAWLLPQPVLIIGTYDSEGRPNAMNAAWGGQWDYHEITIAMGSHSTTDNLDRCGDFTVAFATADTMTEADYVGLVSAKNDPGKMAKTGWTAVKAGSVNAPRFTCFPITLECRIKQKIGESKSGYNLVAEIVDVVCDEKYLNAAGVPDIEKMNLITFDPMTNGYVALGKRVGDAFSAGKALK